MENAEVWPLPSPSPNSSPNYLVYIENVWYLRDADVVKQYLRPVRKRQSTWGAEVIPSVWFTYFYISK